MVKRCGVLARNGNVRFMELFASFDDEREHDEQWSGIELGC